ncbi:4-O-methyl-glucuronoyl methylesterase [Mycena indigotica]|uniref:4-O-methyl-glucuronoyl methylesterase n=1 Tax=Mycena indigotica TaxID=2126181 RepID=A0A8H6S718_9AGAR|nr:4-O-methyl-glucuronoyl methylesterase [Mycena indigotica]KAF7292992.1 4-O-methyl-glucuronoyl methylesterase [Mycena indigotica]
MTYDLKDRILRITMRSLYLASFAVSILSVSGQTAPQYGQCGGMGWTGATTCPSGWTCVYSNAYYSQCLMGTASTTTSRTTTVIPPTSGSTSKSSSSTLSSTPTGPSGPSTTLAPGYSFVRAVEDPNFHKYLMSQVVNTASTAVLGDYTKAAQFQIVNGQLIQNAGGTNLYAVVTPPANSSVAYLAVSWSTKPDTLGTFVFSGDSLEWSSPSVKRQQNNAWLVCPSNNTLFVYINLGAYGYMTPAGCADETLNAYTGTTAVP